MVNGSVQIFSIYLIPTHSENGSVRLRFYISYNKVTSLNQ